VVGPETRDAIRSFEAHQGLPVTGQIDKGIGTLNQTGGPRQKNRLTGDSSKLPTDGWSKRVNPFHTFVGVLWTFGRNRRT
jgi:peptidoglycan hydrolase-like protein with peptidoglycan-binding domain